MEEGLAASDCGMDRCERLGESGDRRRMRFLLDYLEGHQRLQHAQMQHSAVVRLRRRDKRIVWSKVTHAHRTIQLAAHSPSVWGRLLQVVLRPRRFHLNRRALCPICRYL
jgi:hypothetical protein